MARGESQQPWAQRGKEDNAQVDTDLATLKAEVTRLKTEVTRLNEERRRELRIHIGVALFEATATVAVGAALTILDDPLFWIVVAVVALATAAVLLIRTRRRANTAFRERLQGTERALAAAVASTNRLQTDLEATKGTLADLEKTLDVEIRVCSVPIYAQGGRNVIGVDVGRVWLTVGLLTTDQGDTSRLLRLSEHDHPEPFTVRSPLLHKDPDPETDPIDFYGEVAAAIAQVARNAPGEIDGLGIGLPGQIDPAAGRVTEYPQAFAPGEPFVADLKVRLQQLPDQCLQKVCSSNRIFIDNDVRCATRRLLSSHADEQDWANFACVFIGGGVGAGLVLNRQLYYGADRSAGEVGHMTVHLAPDKCDPTEYDPDHPQSWQLGGLAHDPLACECKNPGGVHWETLLHGPGLQRLATQLDVNGARRIAQAFGQPSWEHDRPAPEQITIAIRLLESRGLSTQQVQAALHPKSGKSSAAARTAIGEVMADPEMIRYVEHVRRSYARYFAAGIANLVNVLDLDHVSLGGGVMDALWALTTFREEVFAVLEQHTLRAARKQNLFHYDPYARPGWAWEGAALMFWDPGYEVVRRGIEATVESPRGTVDVGTPA